MGRRASRYARLAGRFWRSIKTERTSLSALGVWALCTSYSSDNLTDGFIPEATVEGFCRREGRRWRAILEELLELKHRGPDREPAPWLHRVEHGYVIHKYLEENISRAADEQRRSSEQDRKRADNVQRTDSERAANETRNAHATSTEVADPVERKQGVTPDIRAEKKRIPGPALDTRHKTQDTRHKTQPPQQPTAACVGVVPTTPAAPKRRGGSSAVTSPVWDAYAAAYADRYGAEPTRNARVNGQLAQFVKRVPLEDAPAIAATYVRSNNRRYVQSGHSVGCLLQDAEKLRTELLTGRQGTAHAASLADKQTGRLGEYERVFAKLRAEDEAIAAGGRT